MKNFKKLIKEAHLGNPLNEEDRATRVDKMLSGEYEDEDYKDSERYADVRADLEREEIEENEKFEKAARDEYGKPWMELSIAQKQELLSYMNRETEKQFQTDYERRRRGDYSDDMEDGMTDYQRRRMDEELKLGVKYELPTGETGYIMTGGSKDPKDWKFSANKESYLSVKDKLKPTKEQPGKYDGAYDMGMGKGHHVDEGTCGYGEDGVIGDKPAGAHLQKEDINDPVLVKARAAKMAAEKEKSKQAELDKKYGSSFMDKLDAEINLKQELQNLKDEREDILMRIEDIGVETEQTAEPEGGPIADELGERLMAAEKELRALDNKIIDVKDELGYFRIYESVNEEYSDLDLYYRKGYKDFTGLVNRIVGEKDLEEKRKLMHVYINILPKASREKKFKLKQSINKMGPSQIDKFAYNILMRDSRMTSLEEDDELNVNVDNANDNYAKAIEKESDSAAYESLQESLRKKLRERLK